MEVSAIQPRRTGPIISPRSQEVPIKPAGHSVAALVADVARKRHGGCCGDAPRSAAAGANHGPPGGLVNCLEDGILFQDCSQEVGRGVTGVQTLSSAARARRWPRPAARGGSPSRYDDRQRARWAPGTSPRHEEPPVENGEASHFPLLQHMRGSIAYPGRE